MSQIQPILLVIRNFLSYGNNYTYIPLNFKKPTLIVGRNLDHAVEGQVDSNGAGKSVIINAISVALYGRTIGNKIKVDKLVNWVNEKNMEVGVHFSKGNEFYYIERYRKNSKKGGDGTAIRIGKQFDKDAKDYEDITPAAGKADEAIEKIIGMPFDVFSRIILYSSSHDSFFDLPTTSVKGVSQASIMEELCNLTELSDRAETLKKTIDSTKTSIKDISLLQTQIISELERHEQNLAGINDSIIEWEEAHQKKLYHAEANLAILQEFDFEANRKKLDEIKYEKSLIDSSNERINQLKASLANHQKKEQQSTQWIEENARRIKTIQAEIERLSQIDYAQQKTYLTELKEHQDKKAELDTQNSFFEAELKTNEKEHKKLSDAVEHLLENKCPYCLQNFAEAKEKIKENVEQIRKLDRAIGAITKKMEENNKEINEVILPTIQEYKKAIVFKSINELVGQEAALAANKDKLDRYSKEINPYTVDEFDFLTNMQETEMDMMTVEAATKRMAEHITSIKYTTERELAEAESQVLLNKKICEQLRTDENPHKKTLLRLETATLPVSRKAELDALNDDLEHQEFLYKLLTKKDSFIRKALMSKNLSYLNQMLKYYREKLGLAYGVNFNYDMTVSITYLKKKIDYEQISTGQRARLNIALWAAMRKVREKRYGVVPFCMVDEALDTGLGNVGVQNAAKMFKAIATDGNISMFVISHRDEIAQMFDSKLEVEMENKFSRVVKSDINVEEEAAA